jgi:hypothetical protein
MIAHTTLRAKSVSTSGYSTGGFDGILEVELLN